MLLCYSPSQLFFWTLTKHSFPLDRNTIRLPIAGMETSLTNIINSLYNMLDVYHKVAVIVTSIIIIIITSRQCCSYNWWWTGPLFLWKNLHSNNIFMNCTVEIYQSLEKYLWGIWRKDIWARATSLFVYVHYCVNPQ